MITTLLSGTGYPTDSADRAGMRYSMRVTADHRKNHGLYLTPVAVAHFMAAQVEVGNNSIRVLDPAAGSGTLLCAVVESLLMRSKAPRHIEIWAYEIDMDLAEILHGVLDDLQVWAAARGTAVTIKIVCTDFVLENAVALHTMGGFLSHQQVDHGFDVVIANPPYFKLNKTDPRVQAAAAVVHGQPNIYSFFMAIGAALLRENGEMVFITPRSFASGPYFRLFREHFFSCIRPTLVHLFGSRRDAFSREAVLQENVILKGIRQDGWSSLSLNELVTISVSNGVADLATPDRRIVRLKSLLDMSSREKVLRLPASDTEENLIRLVDSWPGSISAYGLQISTGPVVPFRARGYLDMTGSVPRSHVPLLWMNHVKSMQVTWPIGRLKPEYIKNVASAKPLLVLNRNYVLLRRFSTKEEGRRLVAGPYLASTTAPMIGLENHLNYIYRPGGTLTEDETFGLAALFSCSLLDKYFRSSNGNTQVSATELRTMPLPSLGVITAIGRKARALQDNLAAIDQLVIQLTCENHKNTEAIVRG